jgi:hypothetical protein
VTSERVVVVIPDRLWDGRVARSLTPHVIEFADADHGLFAPGPLARSIDNLAVLADHVETFLDQIVWSSTPQPQPSDRSQNEPGRTAANSPERPRP